MDISLFDYKLPEELIAKIPAQKRDMSRLMVLDKKNQTVAHKKFSDITDFFDENDVLVMNNTKVLPARLFGEKETGAKIELFLLKKISETLWQALIRPSKRVKKNTAIKLSDGAFVKVLEKQTEGRWLIEFEGGDVAEILKKNGNVPLPPYIEKRLNAEDYKTLDLERYQTIYAQKEGSIAAPTAGLHFTEDIIQKLQNKGVEICYITLNVGFGTFKPVNCDNITEHKMDSEWFEISNANAALIHQAREKGKKITAVGTTTTRALESMYKKHGKITATIDETDIFIYPPYEFNIVDRMITNFHFPKSTLLMMISAFSSRDFIMKAYNSAIEKKYRFYSFGDCMLIG